MAKFLRSHRCCYPCHGSWKAALEEELESFRLSAPPGLVLWGNSCTVFGEHFLHFCSIFGEHFLHGDTTASLQLSHLPPVSMEMQQLGRQQASQGLLIQVGPPLRLFPAGSQVAAKLNHRSAMLFQGKCVHVVSSHLAWSLRGCRGVQGRTVRLQNIIRLHLLPDTELEWWHRSHSWHVYFSFWEAQ